MKDQDISKDPDMIELERMIEVGELDGDRAGQYAREHPDKPHEPSEGPAKQ
jgi:hypothetical protein